MPYNDGDGVCFARNVVTNCFWCAMCEFEFCKGKHACFLADISPCPEYENAKALEELSRRMRRPNSRSGPGFVDIDELVTGADSKPANITAAARIAS